MRRRQTVIISIALLVSLVAPVTGAAAGRQKDKTSEEQRSGGRKRWTECLRLFREETRKQAPNDKKVAMALANLVVEVGDVQRAGQTLTIFEDLERQNKLPQEARPYYAELLFKKYNYDLEHSGDNDSPALMAAQFLSPALQIFLQAYSDESGKDQADARKLADIGWRITHLYEVLGRSAEAIEWLRTLLNSDLSEDARAGIAFYLAVHYWKKAYDLTSNYTTRSQPIPDSDIPQVREWVTEGASYIEVTHTLAPKHANAWFYEKLLIIAKLTIEKDLEAQKTLVERAKYAQYRYIELRKEQLTVQDSTDLSTDRPYASGLPSLKLSGFVTAPAPPPPPPPPPPLRQKPPSR